MKIVCISMPEGLVAGILAASTLLLTTCAAPPESAEQLVERYYDRFQQPGFGVDELLRFYADDVLFIDPSFGITARGKEGVRGLYADIGTDRTNYANIRWDIDRVVTEGDEVVIGGNWSGQFFQCGFDVEFITLWTLENGLIAEQHDFFAASTFDSQVGWDPDTGTANCSGSDPV